MAKSKTPSPRPRFRMFAGPNGSGKSTLYEQLRRDGTIHTDVYVAADRIEKKLRDLKRFSFRAYRVKSDECEFKEFARNSGILTKIRRTPSLLKSVRIRSGVLTVTRRTSFDSYLAACIAAYLVQKLIESQQSFCFETVMSHPSKLELFEQVRRAGYKSYLYFVFTDDPRINAARVKRRVLSGGHDVPAKKIKSRYPNSLRHLPEAFAAADVRFVIDSSAGVAVVAEANDSSVTFRRPASYFKKLLPDFFTKYKKQIR